MKKFKLPILGLGALFFVMGNMFFSFAQQGQGEKKQANAGPWVIPGRTQCIPQRKAILAPTVLHPVTEVKVSVGDTVKKGQAIVQLDDDEPKAEKDVKVAILENTKVARKEAERYLLSLEELQTKGAVSEQRIHDARAAAFKAEADQKAAKAALEASMAELEHYTIEAPIDGVVNRLDVYVGMVSRPGTTVWGEILDLREIDVRIQLSLTQADIVKVGDAVEVLKDGQLGTSYGTGKIVFIGLEANNDKIPALVRLANPEGKLRCEVPVQVRFPQARKQQVSAQ